MYKIEINQDQAKSLEEWLKKDAFYIWMGISQLYGFTEAIICWVVDSEWIESIMENEHIISFKKTARERAIENLLCCWILEIVDWELKFNKDRYMYMNDLWTKVEEEKHSKYKWIWSYKEVSKYEEMEKFVRKLIG